MRLPAFLLHGCAPAQEAVAGRIEKRVTHIRHKCPFDRLLWSHHESPFRPRAHMLIEVSFGQSDNELVPGTRHCHIPESRGFMRPEAIAKVRLSFWFSRRRSVPRPVSCELRIDYLNLQTLADDFGVAQQGVDRRVLVGDVFQLR